MHPDKFDVDVIIIGAGLAGLAAAFAIHERTPTLSLLILDGNDSVGGRTLSTSLKTNGGDEAVFDLGGHFVSKSQTSLTSLLAKLGLTLVKNSRASNLETIGDFEGRMMLTTDDPPVFGSAVEIKEIIKFMAKLELLSKDVSLENPMSLVESVVLDKMTLEAFINDSLASDFSRSFLTSLLRSQFGVEPAEISVLFLLTYCNSTEGITRPYTRKNGGGKEYWIQGGAGQICEKLAVTIGEDNVKTNCAVTKISRSSMGVTVYTAEGQYNCRYVIVALSPPQLLDIIFDPPLSNTRMGVLESMRGRRVVQFVVTYETEFWAQSGYSGYIFCKANDPERFPIIYGYSATSEGHPALAGLLEPCVQNKESHRTEVLNHLAKYFGPEALTPLQYVERNWSEYFGFVSYPGPKVMRHFHEIRRPIGRLFFAGSETNTYWYGHMNGAVHSGYRAAIELLYDLRPQSLTVQDFVDLKPRREMIVKYANRSQTRYRDVMLMIFMTTVVAYLTVKIVITAYTLANKIFPL